MADFLTVVRRVIAEDADQMSGILSTLTAGQYMELAGEADDGNGEPLRALLRCHGDVKSMKIQGISVLASTVAIGFAGALQVVIDVIKEQNNGTAAGLNDLDSQGYAPLHHAAMMGYAECVQSLLEASALVLITTADSKYMLGQSTTIYLEGGLTPLHLAAEKGHLDICKTLLEYKSDVTMRSTFGLTPADIALEKVVLQKANKQWLQITSQFGIPIPETSVLPSRDEVSARRQERMKSLRERIVEDMRCREKAKRASDLRVIGERYVPLDAEIMQGRRKDGSNLIPGLDMALWKEDCISESLHMVRWTEVERCEMGVEEPFPGIFVFELLSEDVCARLWSETVHYLEAAKHHNLPLPMRHDGGLDLAYVFPKMLKTISEAAMPAVRAFLPSELHDIVLQHAFRTYNYVGREEAFKRHVDKYAVTLNVCLHKTPDVQGSGVFFYESQSAESHAYRYEHKVGRACLHSSKEWHMTETLTAGERGSIIMWFNSSDFNNSEF